MKIKRIKFQNYTVFEDYVVYSNMRYLMIIKKPIISRQDAAC